MTVAAGELSDTRCRMAVLRMCGLRPTQQRIALLGLVMNWPGRHFTIEELFSDARAAGISLSLATAYNAGRQFSQAGLIRELPVEGALSYFDTNTRNHQHYFLEEEQRLVDVPGENAGPSVVLPIPPPGTSVKRIDVVIRVRHDPDRVGLN